DKVVGQAVYVSIATGVILKFATSQTGILILVIIPCAILLIIQLIAVLKKINEREDEQSYTPAFVDDEDYREEDFDGYAGSEQSTFTKEIEPPPVVEEILPPEIRDIKKPEAKKTEAAEKKSVQADSHVIKEKPPEAAKQPELNAAPENQEVFVKSETPRVELDRNGKAEYIKQKPTADVSELNKHISPPDSQAVKASHSIDNLKSAIDRSKDLSGVLFDPSLRKKENREESKRDSAIKPVKVENEQAITEKPVEIPKQEDVFIAPRPKKTTTNKALEELMKMLDQKDSK
ncbi:MAG: hypothetical protein WC900_04815, partial [Oscillospiraceae bacterium]